MVELAEKLAALAPGGAPRRVYFGNSGTEAIEAAIKLARYHTGRGQFVAFFGAFHGRTMGSLALTASKSVQQKGFFPVMPGVHHVPYAYCYRCAYGKTPDSCAVECVKVIEDQLFRHNACRRRTWPRFSSSRCRAKAATSFLPRSSSTNCAAWPTNTAS